MIRMLCGKRYLNRLCIDRFNNLTQYGHDTHRYINGMVNYGLRKSFGKSNYCFNNN